MTTLVTNPLGVPEIITGARQIIPQSTLGVIAMDKVVRTWTVTTPLILNRDERGRPIPRRNTTPHESDMTTTTHPPVNRTGKEEEYTLNHMTMIMEEARLGGKGVTGSAITPQERGPLLKKGGILQLIIPLKSIGGEFPHLKVGEKSMSMARCPHICREGGREKVSSALFGTNREYKVQAL